MNPSIRKPEESQEQYRARLRALKNDEKMRRQSPHVLWPSSNGTYRRKEHGPLR